ncbi:hypothetical protein CHRY9390_02602 [Chryseobacterium aquaeductus]|uniref:DUF4377 domain-containing protein n=1 Tax=Chryseobacterium aquaeductus TaxID=2675056 RepID=A0A9N8QST8_9FLAO|nr:DUF4377 domain-containing protein [Chryseobacterium aquaeductus]CAA7331885.1 hypothetical protein CHRY9390_02602 [Chryseobacterium potabilaquae]CAD7813059.1 hypothetical protein CHRY9390_02602 [Chryseobacterium aquaeductus]
MKNILKILTVIFPLAVILTTTQCKPMANSASADEKMFIVASQTVDCTGVAPMKCLQIKEKESDSWGNLYSNIEGFIYEPGFEYVLKLKTEKITNPPADGSSIRYSLVQQVSKTKK